MRLLLPLLLTTLALPAAAQEVTLAQLNTRAAQLRTRLPKIEGRTFTVVVEKPFVVVGDSGAATVRRWANGTIRWAVAKLKAKYFAKDPSKVITVWLMRDRYSYLAACKALTGKDPGTPYGFYSSWRKLMIMNISTGGGTLIHEIVHPYIEANFPDCPSWFNEGMGSMYEQSGERGGNIVGLTNWRLTGLQKAIAAERCPTFAQLTATTTHEFYGRNSGVNYAAARYLLYYLQSKGLLQAYYRQFLANRESDPTGYKTLQAVLGEDGKDMKAFQRKWEAYIGTLNYPPSK